MCAAQTVHRIDGDRDRERPASGDHHPAGIVALGAEEHDVGDDAVAEHDENCSADEFGEEWRHEWVREDREPADLRRQDYTPGFGSWRTHATLQRQPAPTYSHIC